MSERSGRRILADVNYWIALVLVTHPQHERARDWWKREVGEGVAELLFCRVTQLGLLRLLCHRAVMGSARRRPAEAWRDYARLLAHESVGYVRESEGVGPRMHEMTVGLEASAGVWTDAYLAAFASAGQLGLVSFDRGFRRWADRFDLRLLD